MSKHKPRLFEGAATALVTPFKEGAKTVDEVAFRALIEAQLDAGISALVIAGTTGEASTLSEQEHKHLLRIAVEQADGRVPIIAGCGSNDTEVMLRRSKNAAEVGCRGLLLVTPYYNKATPEGLLRSFGLVAERVKLPIILYHVPARTGLTVPIPVFAELAKRENIVAVKEASGSMQTAMEITAACGEDLDVYTGNDELTVPTVAMGGAGVISVLSNLLPAGMQLLCRLVQQGELAAASTLQLYYLPLIRALFSEVNPIPVKTALAMSGRCTEEFRLPMCAMSAGNKSTLRRILNEYGIISAYEDLKNNAGTLQENL
ncbi:MAG: 4-hydroxy-tetrahydrodipicolinate synthase [Clostridia bacterium]|nr:4-hydroxy-tetrahydrodipicolinate synthase [Clostridia bacterium]